MFMCLTWRHGEDEWNLAVSSCWNTLGILFFFFPDVEPLLKWRVFACDMHLRSWPRAGSVNKQPHYHLTITITASTAALYLTSGAFRKEGDRRRENKKKGLTEKERQRHTHKLHYTSKHFLFVLIYSCYHAILPSYILLSYVCAIPSNPPGPSIITFNLSHLISQLVWQVTHANWSPAYLLIEHYKQPTQATVYILFQQMMCIWQTFSQLSVWKANHWVGTSFQL